MSGACLWLLSLLVAIDVRARGRCPTAADVQKRLEPILPRASAGSPLTTDIAIVEEWADGRVSLSLSRSDGGLVGRRDLPRASSCADQADAVAVTLAVWEAALHADVNLALDRFPSEALGVSRPSAEPAPAAVQPPAPGQFLAGVGLGLASALAAPRAVAPEARLDLAWALAGDAWRLRLSAGGLSEHAMNVPPGEVYWQRLFLSAGVDRVLVRFGSGANWKVLLGAGPAVSYVRLRGAGFNIDHRDALADAGGEAAARLERRVGRWRGWLAVTTAWWIRSQRLDVAGRAPGLPDVWLPRGEATVALGASFSIP